MNTKTFLIVLIVSVVVLLLLWFCLKRNSSENFSDESSDWIANIYKQCVWTNAPMCDKIQGCSLNPIPTVSQDWINWAKNSPNALLQYFVNVRRTTQGVLQQWPTSDADIKLNPYYSWDGFVLAVYLWNKAVELNNEDPKKPLGNVLGFCNEPDVLKRSMTLGAFLGNAVVESAWFLVCRESTFLNKKGDDGKFITCPGIGDSFNPRYFNNCDNADPSDYSCQGNAGGGSSDSGVNDKLCSPPKMTRIRYVEQQVVALKIQAIAVVSHLV